MAGPTSTFLRYTRAPAVRLARMETRVKERLVGAIIFVALIVALVPEILSGPRLATRTGGATVSEQPLRTYTIELEEHGFPAVATESEPAEPPEDPAEASRSEKPDAPPSSRGESANARMSSSSTAPTAPQPAPQARAEPPANEPALTADWAVQLGSFSNSENAERLANELRARGYKAFVSRFESAGRTRLRVRVGPEQERARAEQLAQRLRREGRQATVVAHP